MSRSYTFSPPWRLKGVMGQLYFTLPCVRLGGTFFTHKAERRYRQEDHSRQVYFTTLHQLLSVCYDEQDTTGSFVKENL
jgi:hypothetical protein